MRPKDTKVGDIRPQNIFLNEKGHIKVANMHSWPLASTNFSKSMKDEVTYLAPEELTQVKKGHI